MQEFCDPIRKSLTTIKLNVLGKMSEDPPMDSREATSAHSKDSGRSNATDQRQGYYKRQDFPKFSWEARDYPSFARRWKITVKTFLPLELHLDQIMMSVPKKTDAKIKTCQTMAAVWVNLEDEFGKKDEVALNGLKAKQADCHC